MKKLIDFIICLPLGILMSGPFSITGTIIGFVLGIAIGIFIGAKIL